MTTIVTDHKNKNKKVEICFDQFFFPQIINTCSRKYIIMKQERENLLFNNFHSLFGVNEERVEHLDDRVLLQFSARLNFLPIHS